MFFYFLIYLIFVMMLLMNSYGKESVMRTLKDLDTREKRVLVRVDFNVPLEDGRITDDFRLVTALPTIKFLIKERARVILISHLGRPGGKAVPEFKLDPVVQRLEELLGQKVYKADDCIGPAAAAVVAGLAPGEVALLENLRFHPEEEKNDPSFARELASLADCYVNDAFSAAHRAHASIDGVARLLPSAAGYLLAREVEALSIVAEHPAHPFVVILGGAKITDKIGVINNLIDKADSLLIGGGMAFTFLKAGGSSIGKSIFEAERLNYARELLDRAGAKIILPVDVIASDQLKGAGMVREIPAAEIPDDLMGLDIGPATRQRFREIIANAKTIFWNGPLGVFEVPAFAKGTRETAEAVAANAGTTVIGGGDTAAAVSECLDQFTHVSTGGGASLEFLEGIKLPGIAVLE